MKVVGRIIQCLAVFLVLVSCASTKITNREIYVMDNIPRPGRIVVYDFAATADDVPMQDTQAKLYSREGTPQTKEEIAMGRLLGAKIAADLVDRINSMGLRAERGAVETKLQVNDILLWGYFLSLEKGSAEMRFAIGFRQGVAELDTAVEGYQVTAQGLRKLGSATLDSSGGKSPGVLWPAAVMVAVDNPAGLIIGGAVKAGTELSGRNTIEGRADQTAKEIGDALEARFKHLGWIN